MNKQGLAISQQHPEDCDTLHCDWYYDWGCFPERLHDPQYVPMDYWGTTDSLPADYDGFLLMFNEPDVRQPYGANISPELGAERYITQIAKYPQAKVVLGSILAWDLDWLTKFESLIIDHLQPYCYAVHGYVEGHLTWDMIRGFWEEQIRQNGKVWVTEFSETHCDTAVFLTMLEWLRNNPMVERYAAFINRASGSEPWYPGGWKNVRLIEDDGQPTAMGKMMLPMKKIYMPVIIK